MKWGGENDRNFQKFTTKVQLDLKWLGGDYGLLPISSKKILKNGSRVEDSCKICVEIS